jgi:hypothetical protein
VEGIYWGLIAWTVGGMHPTSRRTATAVASAKGWRGYGAQTPSLGHQSDCDDLAFDQAAAVRSAPGTLVRYKENDSVAALVALGRDKMTLFIRQAMFAKA